MYTVYTSVMSYLERCQHAGEQTNVKHRNCWVLVYI